MKRIKLTHYCNLPGAEGQPGNVLEVDDAIAARLIASKGAKPVAAAIAKAAKAEVALELTPNNEGDMEEEPETADAEQREQPESAARRRARR